MKLPTVIAQKSKIMRPLAKTFALTAVTATTLAFAQPALAGQMTFNMYGGSTIGASSSPYVSVQLTSSGGNVNVLVTPGANVGFIGSGSGNGNALLWEMNAFTPTITKLTSGFQPDGTNAFQALGAGSWQLITAGNGISADGSGSWDFGVGCAYSGGVCSWGGKAPYMGSISFTVDYVSLQDFIQNPSGNYFAADICTYSDNGNGCSGATGIVYANGFEATAPEPGTLTLFGAGLLGCALFIGRRRRRARQS